jgi:glutaredoxin-like protein NrdH
MERKVRIFAISTCAWCKKTKRLLDEHQVQYDVTEVDLLSGEEKERVREEVRKHNPRVSYPTLVVDDADVVVGFDEDRIKELLGL